MGKQHDITWCCEASGTFKTFGAKTCHKSSRHKSANSNRLFLRHFVSTKVELHRSVNTQPASACSMSGAVQHTCVLCRGQLVITCTRCLDVQQVRMTCHSGVQVVSGGNEGGVAIWEIHENQLLARQRLHTGSACVGECALLHDLIRCHICLFMTNELSINDKAGLAKHAQEW